MSEGTTETVVGHVPASWPIHTLESLAAFITKGGTPTTYGHDWADASTGTPFFRSECVTDNGFDPKGMNFISPAAHQQMVRSEVKPGDLLMTITGNVGRVAKAPEEFEAANINQHIARIRVLGTPDADADYVYHCLKHEGYAAYYRSILTGQAYPQISLKQVRETPVALPPVEERRKIAAILTAVDDKLDVIARQIEATQTLKQGMMQTLFSKGVGTQDTDGRWMPHAEFKDADQGRVPAIWKVQALEQVAIVERGKFSARPRNDPRYFEGGDIPFVQTGDVAKSGRLISTASQFLNEAGLSVSKLFEHGTIFLTIAANIGDVAVTTLPMACPDSVVGIRAIEGACDPAWLYYLLSANKGYFDSRATQNAQKNINLQVLRPFRFAMPPLAEQAQIGLVLTAVDEKLESLAKRLRRCQALKRGLMQKLLTGEWRVKVDTDMAA
ncbi:restriction endonuclease subunit S [Ideonella sp.]|uniref:restriction endonuclease subunit S n=1 Tax=Ideonella sp. TaxID=1929293 RepID=UPI003BB725CE